MDNRNDRDEGATFAYRSSQERASDTYAIPAESVPGDTGMARLTPGQLVELKGKKWTVERIISESTGEASLYLVRNADNEVFVLKLYRSFSNPGEEPNAEALKRIRGKDLRGVLRLFEYGHGSVKYLKKHCYDITEYALGGDLLAVSGFRDKYTPGFVENELLPQIYQGIRSLHDLKIWHCDLKPGNIFYTDPEQTRTVIGDYGSAKTSDKEMKKDLRRTSTVKITDAYMAPELGKGLISEKADYHSLGMILIHLLYPEALTVEGDFTAIDRHKYDRILERQISGRPLVDFDNSMEKLNNLITGLTLNAPSDRWGKDETEAWIRGETVTIRQAEKRMPVSPFVIGKFRIDNDERIVDFVESRENWWNELIEDEKNYNALKDWVSGTRSRDERVVFQDMINFYNPLGTKYVREAVIRYFDPERKVRIENVQCDFLESGNLLMEVGLYVSKLDEIWKSTDIEDFKFYLFQLEFALRQYNYRSNEAGRKVFDLLIRQVCNIFGVNANLISNYNDFKSQIAKLDFSLSGNFDRIPALFYQFDDKRTYHDSENNSYENLEEIVLSYIAREELYANKYNRAELKSFLLVKMDREEVPESLSSLALDLFGNEAVIFIDINKYSENDNSIEISYTVSWSLDTCFQNKDLDLKYTVQGNKYRYTYQIPDRGRITTADLHGGLLGDVCSKLGITGDQIDEESSTRALESIAGEFRKHYGSTGISVRSRAKIRAKANGDPEKSISEDIMDFVSSITATAVYAGLLSVLCIIYYFSRYSISGWAVAGFIVSAIAIGWGGWYLYGEYASYYKHRDQFSWSRPDFLDHLGLGIGIIILGIVSYKVLIIILLIGIASGLAYLREKYLEDMKRFVVPASVTAAYLLCFFLLLFVRSPKSQENNPVDAPNTEIREFTENQAEDPGPEYETMLEDLERIDRSPSGDNVPEDDKSIPVPERGVEVKKPLLGVTPHIKNAKALFRSLNRGSGIIWDLVTDDSELELLIYRKRFSRHDRIISNRRYLPQYTDIQFREFFVDGDYSYLIVEFTLRYPAKPHPDFSTERLISSFSPWIQFLGEARYRDSIPVRSGLFEFNYGKDSGMYELESASTATVNVDWLNVRMEPFMEARVIGKVKSPDSGEWYEFGEIDSLALQDYDHTILADPAGIRNGFIHCYFIDNLSGKYEKGYVWKDYLDISPVVYK